MSLVLLCLLGRRLVRVEPLAAAAHVPDSRKGGAALGSAAHPQLLLPAVAAVAVDGERGLGALGGNSIG